MVRDGKSCRMPGLCQNDVAPALTRDPPSETLERAYDFARPKQRNGRASDGNFNLTRCHRERHTIFGAHGEALAYRLGEVRFGFRFGRSLADAAGDRQALAMYIPSSSR